MIDVKTDSTARGKLEISIRRVGRPLPQSFETVSYPIARSIPYVSRWPVQFLRRWISDPVRRRSQ